MKPKKKPQRTPKPKNRYRLILQEEGTFEEKWALRVKPGQLRWLALGSILAIIALTYVTVAYTPMREWAVPGYTSSETKRMQAEAWRLTDSLSRELDVQSRYLKNMLAVLEGRVPQPDFSTESLTAAEDSGANTDALRNRSLEQLRHRVSEEDAFAVGEPGGLADAGIWMSPVDGRVSDAWNPSLGHWGVDLVAPANSPVKSVGPGTVIFAGFTAGGGHTVIIQHSDDRLSVYMHNSRLDVTTGDRVNSGDVVAIIGNSGDHSTGPHLHFEWWESGSPVDPALRISLAP
jgi:murein DD-endopeptidase MepM/ murein hydrolase activator NlpD